MKYFRVLLRATIIYSLIFISFPVFASAPISVPPPDVIRSTTGNIDIGVSRQYGGAIVYLKDRRIPDGSAANGNIVDYSNGGTLFTTAIWTLPVNPQEQQYCETTRMVSGVCPGTIYFNNPTQGGYLADGWAGNPNSPSVSVVGNKITVTYRAINYNYDFASKPLTAANQSEWQTDIWGDVDIYFHPTIPDLIVVETKITYCKDLNPSCSGHTIVTQDNQLSTFFAAGESHPDPTYRGSYTRIVFMSPSGYIYGQTGGVSTNSENWVGILQKTTNYGVAMAVENYVPTVSGRFGYTLGAWPSMSAIQPEISNFETSGVSRRTSVTVNGTTYSDIPRYEFNPGGWYKFKTYVATGDINQIRSRVLEAQNVFVPTGLNQKPVGYLDSVFADATAAGWAFDPDHSGHSMSLQFYVDGPLGAGGVNIGSVTTTGLRSDVNGAYGIVGNHGFGFGIPTIYQDGKSHRLYVYGVDLDDGSINTNPLGNNGMSFTLASAADTVPPVVSMSTPSAGSTQSGTAVSVSANASDNSAVAGVQFKLDGVNLGAEDTVSPYSAVWNTTLTTNASHTLTAIARDSAGNTTTSTPISVMVNNVVTPTPTPPPPLPTASISLSPATITSGQSSTLTWSSANATSISINQGIGTVAASGTRSVNPTITTTYTITVTNSSGTAIQNATLTVSPAPDTTPPSVSITSPTSGSTQTGSAVSVTANATDNAGVAGVQFKLDGVNLGAEDTSAPYSVTFDSTTYANSSHAILAIARDTSNNVSSSIPVNIAINNVVAPSTFVRNISISSLDGRSTKAVSGVLNVLNNSKMLIKTYAFTTNSSGVATVTFDIPLQTVLLQIQASPFLTRIISIDLNNNISYNFPTPLTGDINGDNIINSLDFSAINAKWFTSDSMADLNQDGIVNGIDFSLLNKNWFLTGEK